MIQLRNHALGEEIDYTFVMDCFQKYRSPRAKLTALLKNKDLIRVKKGLYVFGAEYRKDRYSLEILANKIYGPSYVSREYALAFYGMIPEHVVEVTSVAFKRSRSFDTPVGRFSYEHLPEQLYRVGYNLMTVRDHSTALIATPEKALADLLYLKNLPIESQSEFMELLFDDLRLDEALVSRMRIGMLTEIVKNQGPIVLRYLIERLRKGK